MFYMQYVTTSKGMDISVAKRIVKGDALFVRRGCKSISTIARCAASAGFDIVTIVKMHNGKMARSKLKIIKNGRGFAWESKSHLKNQRNSMHQNSKQGVNLTA